MAYDIFDLYNVSDPVEAAAKGVLEALLATYFPTATVQVVTTRQGSVKASPRIEIAFTLGSPETQRTAEGQPAGTAKQVPNCFAFTLVAMVCTTRPIGADNADIHGRLVGMTLYGLSAAARPFGDANLPLYQVLDMLPAQVGSRVQDRKSQDYTPIQFSGKIAMRNGTWSVPQPPTPPGP